MNVRVLLDAVRNAVVVPAAALQRIARGAFVYVVKPDTTVSARPVTPGAADGDDVAVTRGLAAGKLVVVDGADRLRDGATVTVQSRAATSSS